MKKLASLVLAIVLTLSVCIVGAAMAEGLSAIGISAAVIAKAVEGEVRQANGLIVEPPEADELYRLFP